MGTDGAIGVLSRDLLEEGAYVLVTLGVLEVLVGGLRGLERVVLDRHEVVDDVVGGRVLAGHASSFVEMRGRRPIDVPLTRPGGFKPAVSGYAQGVSEETTDTGGI